MALCNPTLLPWLSTFLFMRKSSQVTAPSGHPVILWIPVGTYRYPKIDGYPLVTMEDHHFQWENPLFLWSFSIAMLVYQRLMDVYPPKYGRFYYRFRPIEPSRASINTALKGPLLQSEPAQLSLWELNIAM